MYTWGTGWHDGYTWSTIFGPFKKVQQYACEVSHTDKRKVEVIVSLHRLAFLVAPWLSYEVKLIVVESFTKDFLNLWTFAMQESVSGPEYKGTSLKGINYLFKLLPGLHCWGNPLRVSDQWEPKQAETDRNVQKSIERHNLYPSSSEGTRVDTVEQLSITAKCVSGASWLQEGVRFNC